MSTKTFFKRAASVLVASLGFGLLSVPSSQAAITNASLTLSAATATATVGDSASASWTLRFTGDNLNAATGGDSVVVKYGCEAPAGASCPAILARQAPTSDSVNALIQTARSGTWLNINGGGYGESATAASPATSYSAYSGPLAVRSTASIKAVEFPAAGTYTYTFYLYTAPSGAQVAVTGFTAVTWTVTVTAPDTAGASLSRKYLSSDIWTAQNNKKNGAPSSDSAITAPAGLATSQQIVGYAFVTTANAAGDTRVAVGSGWNTVDESLTVTITGAGLIARGVSTTTSSSVTNVNSRGTSSTIASDETIVVYSNGTAGVGTITVTRASTGTTITTFSVTFVGPATSASVALSDTVTPLAGSGSIGGLGNINLTAQLKDAGGNLIQSGTFYVFSSDTVVAGTVPTSTGATSYQTGHRCGNLSDSWNTTTKVLTCPVLLRDTGTAVITLRDSWTVTASTWTSNEVTVDVRGNVVRGITVAFDKATYAPGEKAILTLTATDAAGKTLATRASDSNRLTRVVSTPVISMITVASQSGTQGITGYADTTFLSLNDTGVETRVVTMPTYGTDVSYAVTIPGFGSGVAEVTVTATAKVVDPNAVAQAAAIAAAQAAADAATDAALEAIDAANAATDAANLSAEAADAATVAAEEARDAADAATAAVEALATEVATLMAALKAQITTLARTVAKIAAKVKA